MLSSRGHGGIMLSAVFTLGAERLCCTQTFTVKSPILSIHCDAYAVVRGIWAAGHNGMG